MTPSLEEKKQIVCMNAQVIACPICELKRVMPPSNMRREGDRFKCKVCGTELLIDKLRQETST